MVVGGEQLPRPGVGGERHRLAVDEGLPRMVAEARAHHGRRFGMQALELALADVASGLLAVPRLRVEKNGSNRYGSTSAGIGAPSLATLRNAWPWWRESSRT